MAGKSAKSLFFEAWNDYLENELGVPPTSPAAPSIPLPRGEKAQLRGMQGLANFFMASPRFTGLIGSNGNGLCLTVAFNGTAAKIPFQCFELDSETAKRDAHKFHHEPKKTPKGCTVFSFTGDENSLPPDSNDWYDMTQKSFVHEAKQAIVGVLAERLAAAARTRAALDYMQTLKPQI